MDQGGHDELSVQFTSQAIFIGRMGYLKAKNAFELFENQLNLPTETVKRANGFNRQPISGCIGYKQGPRAERQNKLAGRAAFFLGFRLQFSASGISNLF